MKQFKAEKISPEARETSRVETLDEIGFADPGLDNLLRHVNDLKNDEI